MNKLFKYDDDLIFDLSKVDLINKKTSKEKVYDSFFRSTFKIVETEYYVVNINGRTCNLETKDMYIKLKAAWEQYLQGDSNEPKKS